MDLDTAVAPPGSTNKKLKQNDAGHWDAIGVGDGDPTNGLIENEYIDVSAKGKSKLYDNDDDTLQHGKNKDAGLAVVGGNHAKSSPSGSDDPNNIITSNSDILYHDDDEEELAGDYEDEYGDEDYAEYLSDYDVNDGDIYEDDYLKLQSQFDNVDLPTGVEVSVPWITEPSQNVASIPSTTVTNGHAEVTGKVSSDSSPSDDKGLVASSSSTTSVPNGESSSCNKVEESAENIIEKLKNFKTFDTVEDFSDHHYARSGEQAVPAKNWAKKIQEEWKILENDLPETIFVRVYESRMELLRAVIIGPAGTPYHDGLYVFDCIFPSNYPHAPPMVYYYSGGLRLNPNLYECGKVCLSLLGTWSGDRNEEWIPGRSTMLQVLVSIQALILNARPFFNEPGYESSYTGERGVKQSREYNENVFILSLKTMMYILRRPPRYFEELVKGHFQQRAHNILIACRAYAEGNAPGTITIKDGVADLSHADKVASANFKAQVKKFINVLITNFSRFGNIDCEQFRVSD
ncbi:unnamed protein product [Linum tenue]|uniref:E2 ubiquitin-conjugating enzyme n=1 Tax=Linum tenue TaxID=586396 RepID=A0AAV0QXU7_9ROSI|nr:unnamed protein product [Linum tenue]